MIHHNVLFKLKPETSQAAKDTIVRELEALVDIIPEIDSLRVGSNFSDRGKGFELMLVSTFLTMENLDAYGQNSSHLEVLNTYVKPHLADIVVGDIEV